MRNFVQNWFRINTKMMRNFVQKNSFRAKPRNCCARELTVSWKPYIPYGQFGTASCSNFAAVAKYRWGGDLYGHNMKLPVRKAMSTASSLLYLKVDNLVISH